MPADAPAVKKNPADVLVYAMEFGFQPEIVSGAELMPIPPATPSFTYTEPGSDTSLVVVSTAYSGTQALAQMTGGATGKTYLFTVTVTYQSGRTRALTGAITVDDGTLP